MPSGSCEIELFGCRSSATNSNLSSRKLTTKREHRATDGLHRVRAGEALVGEIRSIKRVATKSRPHFSGKHESSNNVHPPQLTATCRTLPTV